MRAKLKKCPFCGGEAQRYSFAEEYGNEKDMYVTIKCGVCDATGKWIASKVDEDDETLEENYIKAEQAWNLRRDTRFQENREPLHDPLIDAAILDLKKKVADIREYVDDMNGDFEKRIQKLEINQDSYDPDE